MIDGGYSKVYIFDANGFHSGGHMIKGIKSELEGALMALNNLSAPEVKVCDEGDCCIVHIKNGVIRWPEEYRRVQVAGNLEALRIWLQAKIDDAKPTLNWYKEPDDPRWMAKCACGAQLTGVHEDPAMMVVVETDHQRNTQYDREQGMPRDPCGPVPQARA